MQRRTMTTTLLAIAAWTLLGGLAAAESLYELPICKLIEERDPSAQRTALLEHCDLAEQVLDGWFAEAPGDGIPDQEAYDQALYYIATAHWSRLLEIQATVDGPCGDDLCAGHETAQTCPADCDLGDGSSGGGSGPGGPGGGGMGGL
ncbi:MAG: hypothetical protein AAGN66_23405 [Acidobacteriota bacterium]